VFLFCFDLSGHPTSLFWALVRLVFPVAIFSAFMNNTPIVAMLIPIVQVACAVFKTNIPIAIVELVCFV
jgi:Na+/H+ antiporter NhaD/arsenite permease-like protein